jgi:hypothetical protein
MAKELIDLSSFGLDRTTAKSLFEKFSPIGQRCRGEYDQVMAEEQELASERKLVIDAILVAVLGTHMAIFNNDDDEENPVPICLLELPHAFHYMGMEDTVVIAWSEQKENSLMGNILRIKNIPLYIATYPEHTRINRHLMDMHTRICLAVNRVEDNRIKRNRVARKGQAADQVKYMSQMILDRTKL